MLYLTGCGTLETLVNKDGTASSFGNFIGGNKNETLPVTAPTTSGDAKVITLYFPDSTGKYLIKEQRTLPKTLSVARETVAQWLKGPAATKAATEQAAVPITTTLLDIAIKDNIAVVDLSREFLQPNFKVSPEAALYGLVNTLTQYSTIKQVQIRIEGKSLTKYGTIDATKLVNKSSLVKGSTTTNTIIPSIGTSTGSTGTGNGSQSSGQSSGTGTILPDTNNGALPNSPSSINLFNYPPSST